MRFFEHQTIDNQYSSDIIIAPITIHSHTVIETLVVNGLMISLL